MLYVVPVLVLFVPLMLSISPVVFTKKITKYYL